MEWTQPNSKHSLSSHNSVPVIGLTPLLKITEKSTSQSLISGASHLPISRTPSLSQTCCICQLGEVTTENSSQSWKHTSDPYTWSVNLKTNSKILPWSQTNKLLNISLSSINSSQSLVGITMHFNTSSTAEFRPASKMKCHVWASQTPYQISKLGLYLSIATTGNEKKRHTANIVDSPWRKGLRSHQIRPPLLPWTRTTRKSSTRNCWHHTTLICPFRTPKRL